MNTMMKKALFATAAAGTFAVAAPAFADCPCDAKGNPINSTSSAQSIANPYQTQQAIGGGAYQTQASTSSAYQQQASTSVSNATGGDSKSNATGGTAVVAGSGDSTNKITTVTSAEGGAGGTGGTGYGGNAVAKGGSVTGSGNSDVKIGSVGSTSKATVGNLTTGPSTATVGDVSTGASTATNNATTGNNVVNMLTQRSVATAIASTPNGAYGVCTNVKASGGAQFLVFGVSAAAGLHTDTTCLQQFQEGQAKIAAVGAHADVTIAEISRPDVAGCFGTKSAIFINSGMYDTAAEARAEAAKECTVPTPAAAAPPAPAPGGVQPLPAPHTPRG